MAYVKCLLFYLMTVHPVSSELVEKITLSNLKSSRISFDLDYLDRWSCINIYNMNVYHGKFREFNLILSNLVLYSKKNSSRSEAPSHLDRSLTLALNHTHSIKPTYAGIHSYPHIHDIV